jgi:hypothetical protein
MRWGRPTCASSAAPHLVHGAQQEQVGEVEVLDAVGKGAKSLYIRLPLEREQLQNKIQK